MATKATTTRNRKKTETTIPGDMNEIRYLELRRMLEERQREVRQEVQGRMRDARVESASGKRSEVFDQGESSEADIQEEIEFALIQMKAETLSKISEALSRLDEGAYGNCFDCGDEISPKRLRALPFAVRCKDCEEAREVAERRERTLTQRRAAGSLFLDTTR
jgi:DnaK suppressor protein